MATPQKRLDATIASLATRVDASPKRPKSSSPLVRTPKHSKMKTSVVTPNSKRAQPCDRSQDLYKRICKGLIDSTRTPPKNKVLTPTKFFKSRITAAPKNLVKSVALYFCNEPVEYIKDMEKVMKSSGRSRRSLSAAVEMVMPLYNIKTVVGAQGHIEIVADIVQEIFKQSTLGKTKEQRSRRNATNVKTARYKKIAVKSSKPSKVENTTSCSKPSENKPQIYSFEGNTEESIEDKEIAKKISKVHLMNTSAAATGSSKRKGFAQASQPFKKRKTVVYNDPDSSDEDDNIFISTVKPIISEEEKREMQKILGKANVTEKLQGDEMSVDTTEKDDGVERKRKEGN